MTQSDVVSSWKASTGNRTVDKPFAEPDWPVGVPTMSSVPKWLGKDLDIQCSARVESLQIDEGKWHLLGSEETIAVASQLIVAIPSPQAIELLDPIKPEFIDDMRKAVYDPNWTLLVSGCGHQVEAPFDAMTPDSGPLGWIANQASKPQRVKEPAWIAQATAEWSRAHLERSADEVATVLFEHLQEFLGGIQGTPTAHRWRHALVSQPVGQPCLVDPTKGLVACGDWCLGPTVGHAMESGLAAADAILDMAS